MVAAPMTWTKFTPAGTVRLSGPTSWTAVFAASGTAAPVTWVLVKPMRFWYAEAGSPFRLDALPALAANATDRVGALLVTTLLAMAFTLPLVRPAAVAVPNEPRTRAIAATITSRGSDEVRFFMN